MERNLQDALHVARNITLDPRLIPGGGAAEMELSNRLNERSKTIEGLQQLPLQARKLILMSILLTFSLFIKKSLMLLSVSQEPLLKTVVLM